MHNKAKCKVKIDICSVFVKKMNRLFQISGSELKFFIVEIRVQTNFGIEIRDLDCCLQIKTVIIVSFLGIDNWNFSRYPNKDYQLQWIANYMLSFNEKSESQSTEHLENMYRQVNICASVNQF